MWKLSPLPHATTYETNTSVNCLYFVLLLFFCFCFVLTILFISFIWKSNNNYKKKCLIYHFSSLFTPVNSNSIVKSQNNKYGAPSVLSVCEAYPQHHKSYKVQKVGYDRRFYSMWYIFSDKSIIYYSIIVFTQLCVIAVPFSPYQQHQQQKKKCQWNRNFWTS